MSLMHNSAKHVLKRLIELETHVRELRESVQVSIRRSERRAPVFGANSVVGFDPECVRDQLPEKIKNNKYERGIVVAVDYRTETVTVDCGSIIEFGDNEIIYLVFELDFKDVFVPPNYHSDFNEPDSDDDYN